MSDNSTPNTPTEEVSAPPSLVNQTSSETPAEKSEAEKSVETTAPTPLTPDDFKEVEGLTADDPHFQKFLELHNDAALSPKDRAMKLLDLQKEVLKSVSEKGTQDFIKMQEDWREQVIKDPEFANGKLEPALGGISKLLDRFGSPEAREAFDFTGAGNHPAIIKFLAKVSTLLNEPAGDPDRVRPGSGPTDPAKLIYTNTKV